MQPVGEVQLKFNPYHDPRDGRFTFAPGGTRSLSRVASGDADVPRVEGRTSRSQTAFSKYLRGTPKAGKFETSDASNAVLNDGVFRPNGVDMVQLAQYRPRSRGGIGGNSGAFLDPMTLEQTFPGLRDSPGGAIIALADNIFDLTGPAREATTLLSLQYSKVLIERIQAIDPDYRLQSFGTPATPEGQMRQIADLRLDLAATFYRKRGEIRPLQVETLRFVRPSQLGPQSTYAITRPRR